MTTNNQSTITDAININSEAEELNRHSEKLNGESKNSTIIGST